MRYFTRGRICAISLLFLAGCTTNFRELDESQARRQFHVPDEVRLDTLVSSPKEAGWFGREGLRIRAVFRFSEREFGEYLGKLHSREIWEPVAFRHYSPDGAEQYSADAFRWTPLPLPELPKPLEHLPALFDSTISRGYWFCSVILYLRGDSIPHAGGGYHFEWKTRGIHGTAIPEDQHPVITSFGILDSERRMLFVWLGFSG
jgi:hypothetical protein